ADCIIGIFDWLLDAECPLTLLDQLGIRLPRTTGDSSKPLLNQTRRSTIFGSRTVCSPNQAIGTLFFGSDDINRRDRDLIAGQPVKWWTRTQRIRTVAQIPLEAALLDIGAAPIYQQIAAKALHLQQLGLSYSVIARKLNVTDKTVAKAIAWLGRTSPPPDE
ncbi:MAG: hypothetical protein KAT30_02020, partial [Candidatus Krumholzibacteria bacterium]|nr:hypothetical protein [Candidatus Krumholzibacteria bacterium]